MSERALPKVTVDRFFAIAPRCFLVCRVHRERTRDGREVWEWDPESPMDTVPIERGAGWIKLARDFGWNPKETFLNEVHELFASEDYLNECIRLGTVIDDPGYFDE